MTSCDSAEASYSSVQSKGAALPADLHLSVQ